MFAILEFACHTLSTSLSIALERRQSPSCAGTAALASFVLPFHIFVVDAQALVRSLLACPAEVGAAYHPWILISLSQALLSPCQVATDASAALLPTSTRSGGVLSQ
jgi:hypothetical protein